MHHNHQANGLQKKMETARPRRKRYCCYYCHTYFYQVDSWQRHNRKHTSVEIECDDCGQMCSDHVELRTHLTLCEAYHVYSEDVYTQPPTEDLQSKQTNSVSDNESVLETPDSTSKQELPDTDSNPNNKAPQKDSSKLNERDKDQESLKSKEYDIISEADQDTSTNLELDHLIGEDKDQEHLDREEEDPETEALIGIDQNQVSEMNKINTSTSVSSDAKIDTNFDGVSNNRSQPQSLADKFNEKSNLIPFSNDASQIRFSTQSVSLDNSELSKKYQPYFCKNCGARFTRKDSVTRHLKKGTCSGKSAIVCNICGKVFGEMFELQEHFKREHKNVVFTPTVVHRSILPRTDTHEGQSSFSHFPTHFIVRDQHMLPVNRPYHVPESPYCPMPPGIQTMFYGGGQTTFSPRSIHPRPLHYHEQKTSSRPIEFPPNGHIGKDFNYVNRNGKLMFLSDDSSRKRDHTEYSGENDLRKIRKTDVEYPSKQPQMSPKYKVEKQHENINLSEYTNSAMSSKQYYSSRFIKKEPAVVKDETPRTHQCKVCGLEFPRFEYLLTHLRKHKEKNEVESFENNNEEDLMKKSPSCVINQEKSIKHGINDSNSNSSDENIDHKNHRPHYLPSNLSGKLNVTSSNQQPSPTPYLNFHYRYNNVPSVSYDRFTHKQDSPHPLHQTGPVSDSVDSITPGIDGKFRPFICENCGQRFTRKDSLVRHSKKQTCFEEGSELKCDQCDKIFRYHKCLLQHQELVHGVAHAKSVTDDEQSESESEKNGPSVNVKYPPSYEQQSSPEATKDKAYTNPTNSLFGDVRYLDDFKSQQLKPHMESNSRQQYNRSSPVLSNQEDSSRLSPRTKGLPLKPEENDKPLSYSGKDGSYIGYCMLPRPFQCEYCGDRFAHRHSLKRHVRRHLGIGIPCNECGKLYRDQSEWRRHQRSIHNRHYEKYEVPRRMTYRDGVDQGLIGVASNSDNENHLAPDDVSESENDEDSSTSKYEVKIENYDEVLDKSPSMERNNINKSNHADILFSENVTSSTSSESSFSSRLASFGFHNSKIGGIDNSHKQVLAKDEKLKALDFKTHVPSDKDSRKSVLDLYLCSPNSDENDDKNNNKKEKEPAI